MTSAWSGRYPVLGGLLAVVLAAAGCSLSVNPAKLPGGPDVGSHPLHLSIEFVDAQDLSPGSDVKVNNVAVGKVTSMSLDGWLARVDVEVRGDVTLPANAGASVLQTSLLGENYVELGAPLEGRPVGRLRNGQKISILDTTTNASVEQVLGAISLLLTGGAFTQLQRIVSQLNRTFTPGNLAAIRDLLAQLQTVATALSDQRTGIVTAIVRLNGLARTVAAQDQTITNALTTLPPAAAVLREQTQQLVTMLSSIGRLSTVATKVIDAGGADFAGDLKDLQPVLTQLQTAGRALPDALQIIATYPLPGNITSAVRGDYVNGNLSLSPALSTLLSDLLVDAHQHGQTQQAPYAGSSTDLPPAPGACGRPFPKSGNGSGAC